MTEKTRYRSQNKSGYHAMMVSLKTNVAQALIALPPGTRGAFISVILEKYLLENLEKPPHQMVEDLVKDFDPSRHII